MKFFRIFFIISFLGQIVYSSQLSVYSRNISDNKKSSELNFGIISVTETYKLAGQYLKLEFQTFSNWRINIYTNNENANCGYQKGGLINESTNTLRMPLQWKVFAATQTQVSLNSSSGWLWLKDKGDEDLPETINSNESWSTATAAGYTNVVYGGTGYSNLNNGTPCDSFVIIYLKSILEGVASGDYSGKIYFDFDSIDNYPPYISHSSIEKIGLVGDDLIINAEVSDDTAVKEVKFHYKLNGSSWNVSDMTFVKDSTYTYSIDAEIVKNCEKISYCILARDSFRSIYWNNKGEDNPQEIEISRFTEWENIKAGFFSVDDGNSETGDLSIFIPEGALTENTNITFEQKKVDDSDVPNGNSPASSLKPVAVYNFGPSGLKFKKPVDLTLRYFDSNESNLAVFYYDGFEWRIMGGEVNEDLKTVKTKTSHFSLFAIFSSKALEERDFRPAERIITPGYIDGLNDSARFDGLYDGFEIKIFDITGRVVKKITESPAEWDGTDESGNVVESGIYVYQLKANINGQEKVISGVIAVAK